MRIVKHISFALLAGSILLATSCSNQMYSYREKVKVETQAKVAKPTEKAIQEIDSKMAVAKAAPAPEMKAPDMASAAKEAPKVNTEKMKPVLKDIQQMVPQYSSKAIAHAKTGVKSVKEQAVKIRKDIKKAQSGSVAIDGVKWMIVGAILVLAAWIISFFISGGLIAAISAIGGLIFVIGLIFWLLEILV